MADMEGYAGPAIFCDLVEQVVQRPSFKVCTAVKNHAKKEGIPDHMAFCPVCAKPTKLVTPEPYKTWLPAAKTIENAYDEFKLDCSDTLMDISRLIEMDESSPNAQHIYIPLDSHFSFLISCDNTVLRTKTAASITSEVEDFKIEYAAFIKMYESIYPKISIDWALLVWNWAG